MKKKIIIIIIAALALVGVLAACTVLAACFIKNLLNDDTAFPSFLTSHDWESADDNAVCTESICFNKGGHFSYYCGCGSGVGDYDRFDKYIYDGFQKNIYVFGFGVRRIKVLYHNSEYLFLKFNDGTVKAFVNENARKYWSEIGVVFDITEDAPFCTKIVCEEDGNITFLPYNYSGHSEDKFKMEKYTAPLSDDVEVYTLFAKEAFEGEEDFCEYNEISLEGAFESENGEYISAYMDFNEKGEIDRIIKFTIEEIED